ncbi:15020_t:CDS:1 [Funneliformis geosporum]|uniref:5309_t:CDS:1 n=1 Tax=Funneliformis geosporum TaxID=1117311 RepID=A0A9W4WR25_9GLOM|nr:15020_t:CDS:1 [Funneliformis geosporum]CAI2180298.1 5309_t:CDS:1 [Funneliformis geosporum]
MASDLTVAIIALSVCLWLLVIHVQTPIELIFQTTKSIINENNPITLRPDNDDVSANLYRESTFDFVPITCKETKAIISKSMNVVIAIGIITFFQFPDGLIHVSGEINNVIEHVSSNRFYFEIITLENKGVNVIIRNDELFINRKDDETIHFMFNTRLISMNNKCNINQRRRLKNVIGKKFSVYIMEEDDKNY